VVAVNAAAENNCGFSRRGVIGKPFDSLPKICAGKCVEILRKTLREKRSLEVSGLECPHGDRPTMVVNVTTSPLLTRNGTFSGAVMVVRDETRLAEYAAELKVTNQELENEIATRKTAEERLEHAVSELRHSNAELEQFASVVSHDLKEPLLAVACDLKLLQRGAKKKGDPQFDKYLEDALEGAQRMETFISELLAYSRVGARQKTFRPIDVSRVLARALENLKVVVEQTGADVTQDRLPEVTTDPTLLAQVFQNLVNNAIKFRGEETPHIHISALRKENNWVFSVRDNGIGIAREHAEQIFEIFHRLHPRKKYPGTGVGLAICKKIVELHGGEMWVESEPGQGSIFYFTIPVKM
jgi:light-regulated signal transduction histidine kinase (bacteriophytochrome)